jgi:endoglucanase
VPPRNTREAGRRHRALAAAAAALFFVAVAAAFGGGAVAPRTLRTVGADVPGDAVESASPLPTIAAAPGGASPSGGSPMPARPSTSPVQRTTPAHPAASPNAVSRGLGSPTGGLSASPRSGVRGPLQTSGNRIVDAGGQPVVLRGLNRVGLEQPGISPAVTDAEIGHARAWGANVIRIPVGEAYWSPQCPSQYVPSYQSDVDALVHWVTSRGMVALLDLHTVTRTECGQSGRWRMADAPGSLAFWASAAAKYKADPLVAFELYNEPNDLTSDQWRNGGQLIDQTPKGTVSWTAAGMQQLYDVVRSAGADNLVIVTGNGYGGDPTPILDGHALTGTNVVYAVHAYTCPEPSAVCILNPGNKKARISPLWSQVAQQHPIMITEFGWPNAGDSSYNASVTAFAQAQNPPWGWTAFAWDGTNTGAYGLVANLTTYEPTPSGGPVKAALANQR